MLDDHELELFSRQLILDDFTIDQQQRLKDSTVLVAGVGGLGCAVSTYLAAVGVGELRLVDHDVVELSNLQRQTLYGDSDLGLPKAQVAKRQLDARYSHCKVGAVTGRIDDVTSISLTGGVDVVADCSDDFSCRYALNRACLARTIPLVSAAAVRGEGQLTTFPSDRVGPCYRCLYPDEREGTGPGCSQSGVVGPVVGVFGALQSLEVVKVLTGWGENLTGVLLLHNLKHFEFHRLSIARDPNCPDCAPLTYSGNTC